MRHLLTLDDLTHTEVAWVLDRARDLEGGSIATRARFDAAMVFLESSLRTRTGFAVASARLGGDVVDVSTARWQTGMTEGESFSDTLRTITGIVDVAVVRCPFALDRSLIETSAASPIVNAGDASAHPTQALIDLAAIRAEAGPIDHLKIAVVGDLTMRATRSLLHGLRRYRPARLVLVAPPSRRDPEPPMPGAEWLEGLEEVSQVDVLYLGGLPEGDGSRRLEADERSHFRLDGSVLDRLGSNACVLSPMPVIDEIATEVRTDPRIRMYAQSDRGVFVRMAVLQLVLDRFVN